MHNCKGWILVLASLFVISLQALGDEDEHEENGSRENVAPVENTIYTEECGACHFAYPPGLLPARSWEKLMSQLQDHFGENAELFEDEVKSLTLYMVANAADHSSYPLSKRIAKSVRKNDAPLRITLVPYIEREHRAVPKRFIEDNPKVKSRSRCDVCHTNAAKGSFDEDDINVPPFVRLED